MRALIPLLALLSLAACGDLIKGPAPESRGLVLSLGPLPAEVAPGDTVRIRMRLTNTNPVPVTLEFGTGCQILYYIENAAGEVVEPQGGGWFCAAVLTRQRLRAGETTEQTSLWFAQRTRFEPGRWEPIREPLPPGEYRVYATMMAGEVDGRRISLRTPDARIRVR